MNPKVDHYLDKASQWQEEMQQLRSIALDCKLNEEFKWGCPCYTLNKGNVIIIHSFKNYCAFLFFKGALIEDTENILIQQTDNVRSARQIRFTNIGEIEKLESILKSYIYQAIEIEKSGLKIEPRKDTDLVFPEEFQDKLDEIPDLKTAFESLTPGRQRAYNLYFSNAKQSKTRASRIENYIPKILKRKGLDDN